MFTGLIEEVGKVADVAFADDTVGGTSPVHDLQRRLEEAFARRSLDNIDDTTPAAVCVKPLLLALDWAALHDIVGGRQPTARWEYAVLAASFAVFIYLASRRLRRSSPAALADTPRAGSSAAAKNGLSLFDFRTS